MSHLICTCNALSWVLWAIKCQSSTFRHISKGLRIHDIHFLDQESVHWCSLGCSTWSILDFWKCRHWAVLQADSCWFFRYWNYSMRIYGHFYFEFFSHKSAQQCKIYYPELSIFCFWKFRQSISALWPINITETTSACHRAIFGN